MGFSCELLSVYVMRCVFCLVLMLAIAGPLAGQAPAPAAAPADIQAETNARMEAALKHCQGGEYKEALTKIEQVKKNLENRPFPQVLFVEGASYFNLNEYDKAIAALEEYAKNFEDGDYISLARMALGRSYINKG